MTKKYITWITQFLAGVLTLLILLALGTFIIDPYQYYRKAEVYKPVYLADSARYMNPGVIKNFQYDSAVVGNSMTENFLTEEIKNKLNWNCIKLSMEGATPYELSLVYEALFKENKVKNILTTFDFFTYELVSKESNYGMPTYLYNDSKLDDIRYLLNLERLKNEVNNIRMYKDTRFNELNYAYFWGDIVTYSREEVLNAFKNNKNLNDIGNKINDRKEVFDNNFYMNMVNNFDNYFYKYIKDNPEVNFNIILPPYSVLYWKDIQLQGNFDEYQAFRNYSLSKLVELDNVKLYDFQSDTAIIYEINWYKDIAHYSHEISSYMVNNIENHKYRITKENWKQSITDFEKVVDAYDREEIFKLYSMN